MTPWTELEKMMCPNCIKFLARCFLVASIIFAVIVGIGSAARGTYERNRYYRTFIGREVRIKNNGKIGVISGTPDWMAGFREWYVRDKNDRLYMKSGEELELIEE